MNILIITIDAPYPPTSGGTIRVHGIVEGLRRAGHRVTVVCFHEGGVENVPDGVTVIPVSPRPHRRKIDRLRTLLITRQPDISRRFYGSAMRDALRDLLQHESFDVAQFEGIEAGCYQAIVAAAQPSALRVFDTFNAEYDLQRTIFQIDRAQPERWPAALYSYLQVGRIERYERDLCRNAAAVIAVSDSDAELLQPFRDDRRVHVVNNGIWTERYAGRTESPFQTGRNIVFTGTMDYRPNVDAMLWFTESILPYLHDVHLTIVGIRPHPRLDHLRDLPNVTITGRVESVMPYLQHATVYVAPLRMGGGTRLKLLEAMACGCPIVATRIAASGMNAAMSPALSLADEPSAFVSAIHALLDDPARRAAMTEAGQSLVKTYYDWSAIIPLLLAVYRETGVEV